MAMVTALMATYAGFIRHEQSGLPRGRIWNLGDVRFNLPIRHARTDFVTASDLAD